jgi:hypothetical protein
MYHMYYTGLDSSGGIIGLATAPDLMGPWTDLGSILEPVPGEMLESPTLAYYSGHYYLFYNLAQEGGYFRIGDTHFGAWQQPFLFRPGWAHEIWQSHDGGLHTSYLTDYTVTINPIMWDDFYFPPHPTIESVNHLLFPLITFSGTIINDSADQLIAQNISLEVR